MNRIVDIMCKENPHAKHYKAHESLRVMAVIQLENRSVLHRFFKSEEDAHRWFFGLAETGRVVLR